MEHIKPQIILASASARRARILTECGIPFTVCISHVDEVTRPYRSPRDNVLENARLKAEAVSQKHTQEYVIGVDTVVSFQDHIIGKPRDMREADSFLKLFSGNDLVVYSGISVVCAHKGIYVSGVDTTSVRVRRMSKRMRGHILECIDPLDRAGGFSIEGIGSFIFDSVDGSFYNVLGLPMARLYDLFRDIGVDLLDYV